LTKYTIEMDGHDCDISVHDTIAFTIVVVIFRNLIGAANFLAAELTL